MTRGHIGAKAAGVIALGLVPAVAALVALATVTSPNASGEQQLNGLLAARVTTLLEQATPAEHTGHGHKFDEDDGKIICAVEPFGTEPSGARDIAEVKVVYARHMCAVTGAGNTWSTAVRASGPLAVRLAADGTAELEVPTSGSGYPERVRKLVPPAFHQQAFADFDDSDVIDRARDRFKRATG